MSVLVSDYEEQIERIAQKDIAQLAIFAEPDSEPESRCWRDIFCHDCDTNECLFGTAEELARKVHVLHWALDINNEPLCPKCAEG